MHGDRTVPHGARGVVVFAHGSSEARVLPRGLTGLAARCRHRDDLDVAACRSREPQLGARTDL